MHRRPFVAAVILFAWAPIVGCQAPGGIKITPVPADQTLHERIVQRCPGWVSDRIAIVDIGGVLMNDHEPELFGEGEHPVSLTVEKLHAAASDARVKAVVLRINSPGGTVTASDLLYREIKSFKEKSGKPVVAYFMDVAASGGYYLACAADEIVAHPTSITGSIGVVMQMVDLSGTLAKIGVKADAIVSGPHKDTGSPFRAMRPEEREMLQHLVDGFYQQFVEVVDNGRPKLRRDDVLKLADGRVYNSQQAMEAGLIDRVGTLQVAIEQAQSRAGIDRAHVVLYQRPLDWKPNVYAATPSVTPIVNIVNVNLPKIWTNTPRFLYLWSVGS